LAVLVEAGGVKRRRTATRAGATLSTCSDHATPTGAEMMSGPACPAACPIALVSRRSSAQLNAERPRPARPSTGPPCTPAGFTPTSEVGCYGPVTSDGNPARTRPDTVRPARGSVPVDIVGVTRPDTRPRSARATATRDPCPPSAARPGRIPARLGHGVIPAHQHVQCGAGATLDGLPVPDLDSQIRSEQGDDRDEYRMPRRGTAWTPRPESRRRSKPVRGRRRMDPRARISEVRGADQASRSVAPQVGRPVVPVGKGRSFVALKAFATA
jgi:hypothetical protein